MTVLGIEYVPQVLCGRALSSGFQTEIEDGYNIKASETLAAIKRILAFRIKQVLKAKPAATGFTARVLPTNYFNSKRLLAVIKMMKR